MLQPFRSQVHQLLILQCPLQAPRCLHQRRELVLQLLAMLRRLQRRFLLQQRLPNQRNLQQNKSTILEKMPDIRVFTE